jgi:amidase
MATNPARGVNPVTATATDLQAHLSGGDFNSVDLIQHYRRHIRHHDGYLRAMISLAPEDLVLARARQLDEERKQGKVRGVLHGLPIVVKVCVTDDAFHAGLILVCSRMVMVGQCCN